MEIDQICIFIDLHFKNEFTKKGKSFSTKYSIIVFQTDAVLLPIFVLKKKLFLFFSQIDCNHKKTFSVEEIINQRNKERKKKQKTVNSTH